MNVDIIGSGYVGLVAAACLSNEGHIVTGYDIDSNKIKSISKGKIPFYEPGLTKLVNQSIKDFQRMDEKIKKKQQLREKAAKKRQS